MRVRRSGFALVVVLLAVGAMFALAIRSAVVARTGAIEVSAVRERARAEREARAAVVIALSGLLPAEGEEERLNATDGDPGALPAAGGSGAAREDGIEIPEILKAMAPEIAARLEEGVKQDEANRGSGVVRVSQGAAILGSTPRRSILNTLRKVGLPSRPVEVELGDRVYEIELRDAAGLLNINEATRDMLVRYLNAKKIPSNVCDDIADQIIDWRDIDSVSQAHGAEQETYEREGIKCRNAAMESLEELRFLPAMTAAIFDAIRPDLCIAGGGRVHVGSASREVLMALPGMDEDVVSDIIGRREAEPITEKTLDEMLPRSSRAALRDMVRADPSGAVAVRVRGREAETGRPLATVVGVAMISDEGIRAVGVRAE